MQPGTRIGTCEVVREIARGGQGAVYEARDLATGEPRALECVENPCPRGKSLWTMLALATLGALFVLSLSWPALLRYADPELAVNVAYLSAFGDKPGERLDTETSPDPWGRPWVKCEGLQGTFVYSRGSTGKAVSARDPGMCGSSGLFHWRPEDQDSMGIVPRRNRPALWAANAPKILVGAAFLLGLWLWGPGTGTLRGSRSLESLRVVGLALPPTLASWTLIYLDSTTPPAPWNLGEGSLIASVSGHSTLILPGWLAVGLTATLLATLASLWRRLRLPFPTTRD